MLPLVLAMVAGGVVLAAAQPRRRSVLLRAGRTYRLTLRFGGKLSQAEAVQIITEMSGRGGTMVLTPDKGGKAWIALATFTYEKDHSVVLHEPLLIPLGERAITLTILKVVELVLYGPPLPPAPAPPNV